MLGELRDQPALINNLPRDEQIGGSPLIFAYMLLEARALLAANPDYTARLAAITQVIDAGNEAGLSIEEVSAALFATAIPSGVNAITVGGGAHISGVNYPKYQVDGLFHEHLKSEGLRSVTPMLLTSREDLETKWEPALAPGGPLEKMMTRFCSTFVDTNIYIFDTNEVFRNVSKLSRRTPLIVGSALDNLLDSRAVFSCVDPRLPRAEDIFKGATMNPMESPAVASATLQMKSLLFPPAL